MQKKNVQAPIKSHPNDSRRSSCPASKDKPKKKDFLTYQKNGSAQISRTLGEKVKRTSEALSEREANHLYSEIQKAHTNLPKPEEHPTLQDEGEGYHSDITPRSQEIEHEQLEQNFQDIPPIPHEEQTGTTKPQSMQSKSVERSSKIFTESDEEKEDDRETEKKPDVEYPMDIRIEDLHTELERFSHNRIPSTQGGRTFNIDQAPLTGPDLNASHSSKSTVLLAESPRGSGGKREHQMTQETEGSADTKEPEIQESFEIKPPKSITTEATRVIDNVVAHDGPLIQPKPQEVTHANSMSMKNKINLEIYLKVENLLYVIKESIMSGKPIFQFCRDYIEVAPKIDRENFEKILTTEQERKLVKSSFIVKRLGIILMLYFTVENKPNEKAMFQLKSLINSIHQNFIIVGYLISLKLKDKTKANVWTARLMELLEHDSSANFTKNENLDKLAYNNTNICNIMKNLIVSMRNKEILYAFNSIVIQLDRISIKEAYTRLLKSFSVFMSEKELRSQVTQYAPKKPVPESKVQQLLKVEKEKKKDELAFLPKLVKGGVESQYTLVVDLDETLVHYAELPGKLNELRVRPYVAHFLTEVSKYYEIVVFTAAMQEYADWVLDNIDKEHCVTHRLYRQHASPDGYNFVKDLSKLGRDMARIMIVDNLAENFRLQPDNGIYIKPWYDDPEDTALLELTPLLVEIARKKVTDVRVALRRFRDQMIENIEKGFENPHLNLQLD